MAEDYDMIKDDNSPGGPDSGMDELQFDDIDSMLGSNTPEPSKPGGLEDMSIDTDPLESLVASSGEEYPSSFENDFSFHPGSVDSSLEDPMDLELTDPLVDAEIDKLLDINDFSDSSTSKISNLESDDSFFTAGDSAPDEGLDFSELDSYLTEEPDAISFDEELDDPEEFDFSDLEDEQDDLDGSIPPDDLKQADLSFDEDDFLSEEEGPIALSGNELDDILNTADESDANEDLPDFITHTDPDEDEGPISLSDDELGHLLADNAGESDSFADLETEDEDQPIFSEIGSEEDNEPISLSLAELEHIQSEDEEETLDETGFLGGDDFGLTEESLSDSSDFSFEPGDSEEDTIALSEEELGNLLSDDAGIEVAAEGFGDLLENGELPEDSGSMFGENVSLTVEQDLGEPDEFDPEEESFPEDFSPEPNDFLMELDGENDNEPIALSDEELGNLLSSDETTLDETVDESISLPLHELDGIEEENVPSSLESLEDFELPTNDFDSLETEDEAANEPIALSNEELDHILAEEPNVSEELPGADTEIDWDAPVAEQTEEDEESIALSDDELGNLLASENEEVADSSFDFEPETTSLEPEDEDANEPIALSEDELGNLLASENEEVADSSFDFEPETTPLETEDEDANEPIALSEDELGNLLASENEEVADSSFDFEPETTPLETEDEDANEPIALSEDELGNLLASENEEVADSSFDFEPETTSLETEDEDANEPIALSEDELGNLLAEAPVVEEEEDLNQILGELPRVSDLDAFDSIDDDVSRGEDVALDRMVPTLENIDDEEMIILLDEYADGEETSPIEDLRKTPDQTEAREVAGETPSKDEMKRIMTYLDELLGNLPDDLIREFSRSDYFELYKKLMKQIGV
ncbi:hypothetical protein LEP1GSC060_1678 [Leptospira weilii serovar Ranarum str. ICFT]|uniref:Uncharacterized protein n=1 Tax=Leptospira weilii serovar Ranarum str. ICFT TaxID=1218598 RepID=N1W7W3_9LEPT|nr:hypothetical protein [Leptospira weilii]EMY76321.1 hypothetical protein LEP1GSC060_1678 [Leptospira weilii serovar Ranarum str. ICFT]